MKHKILICLLASLLTYSAFAKTGQPKRRVADESPEEDVAEEAPVKRKLRSYDILFGVNLGLASLSDSGSSSRDNFAFGVIADFREMRYFGLEGEGLYGLPKTTSGIKSEFYGGIGFLKLQLPINLDVVVVTPKAGGGYGFFSYKSSIDDNNSDETTLEAPYLMGGIDVELFKRTTISLDYASGLKKKAKLKSKNDLGEATSDQGDATGKRIRAGVVYELFPHTAIGLQYLRRSFEYTASVNGEDVTLRPSQNHFLFLLLYKL